jgi:hypothetical protein
MWGKTKNRVSESQCLCGLEIPRAYSLWEGDKIFLKLLMAESPFFTLKLCYAGDTLVESKLGK